MMPPQQDITIDSYLRRKIAAQLVTNYHGDPIPTVQQMLRHVPSQVKHWKKIKLLNRDEVIREETLIGDETKSHRDNTFVKVRLARHLWSSLIHVFNT
jgi:hypothetical protein